MLVARLPSPNWPQTGARLKTTVPLSWIFPLTVFGIGAASIRYFDLIFTAATRWLLLAGLALFLLSRAKLFLSLRVNLAPVVTVWIGWVALTVLWSDVPALSFLKAIALAVTVLSLVSGGVYWAQYAKPANPLTYLAPLTALALFAGLFGLGTFRHISQGVPLFEGLSENVNAFAIILAVGLAFPLYAAYRASRTAAWGQLGVWLCVTITLLIFLVMTRSRASIAAGGCVLLSFAVAAVPRRILLAGAACAVVAFSVIALTPALSTRVVGKASHFLDKGHDNDPFFTRRDVWRISYEHAVAGGVIGLGLGVSDDTHGEVDAGGSATGYGREKGSSQLAIVEETGLIGLAIYVYLLWRLFSVLISRTIAVANRDAQVAATLTIGVLAGLVVQSLFEAWWTSPGSFGSMVFWSTAGVAIGILRHWRPVVEQPLARAPSRADMTLATSR